MERATGVIPSSVILHVDLDCFYAAVEHVRLGIPREKPLAVQQWEGLIAVNYAARAAGVVRHDRVSEALRKCPDLHLVHVETIGNDQGTASAASRSSAKVSLERYRQASRCVFEIFCQHADICERASIDEAYLDITRQVETMAEEGYDWDYELQRLAGTKRMSEDLEGTEEKGCMFIENGPLKIWDTADRRLLAGAIVADRIRMDVRTKLGYTCSVGIATNKLLSKIASARHKPDQQTLIPPRAVAGLMNTLPLKKVKLLGGKIGEELSEKWGCSTAGEAQKVPLKSLLASFGDRLGQYVYEAVRGIHEDKVHEKQIPKSMLAAKSFQVTQDLAVIRKWLGVLAEELSIRMVRDARENHRQPHSLQLYYRSGSSRQTGDHSKSCPMPRAALQLLSSLCSSTPRSVSEQKVSESASVIPENDTIFEKVTKEYDAGHLKHNNKLSEGKSKVGSQTVIAGVCSSMETERDLADLLQQASFQLFQRIGDAFPCTRLAIAASGFQDAPMQGSQSIQHFFVNAFQGVKVASPKLADVVEGLVGADRAQPKLRGLLRYIHNNCTASKHLEALPNSSSRKECSSSNKDTGSLYAENSCSRVEGIDNCRQLVPKQESPLNHASTLSPGQKSTSGIIESELGCRESPCQLEQRHRAHLSGDNCENDPVVPCSDEERRVDVYNSGQPSSICDESISGRCNSQSNPTFFTRSDSPEVFACSSGQLQSSGDINTGLGDTEELVHFRNINVEEQHRILEDIYVARSAGKGRMISIRKNCMVREERQVAKRRKLTSSKPGQMPLSKYFQSIDGSPHK